MYITFKLLSNDDCHQLHQWLQIPHVREFWDDGDRTIEQVRSHYIKNDDVKRYLFCIDNNAAGYIQSYFIDNKNPYSEFISSDTNATGLDFFIGNINYLGKRLSIPILNKFISSFCQNSDQILVDPESKNHKALHIYQKMGFKKLSEFKLHNKLHQMMIFNIEKLELPNEEIASSVVFSMTGEKVLFVNRMATGDQYFVFAIKTTNSDYVIRMTNEQKKDQFLSAMYWQEKLIPLGIPLAKFIQSDLEGRHSKFPALLMHRLPGNDLCNVYSTLSATDKRNLAVEMVKIQAATNALPEGKGFGIAESYKKITVDKTWFDFLLNRLQLFKNIIKETAIFDLENVEKVISLAKNMQEEFNTISAKPFMWDASERNVILHNGKISGIVDVDDMCFGDPLFVIGLTSAALENEGFDTLYTDY